MSKNRMTRERLNEIKALRKKSRIGLGSNTEAEDIIDELILCAEEIVELDEVCARFRKEPIT